MLRFGWFFSLFVALFLISGTVLANNKNDLQKYIASNFAQKIQLNARQIEQLSWVLDHSRHTNDMDRSVDKQAIHIEVSRSLTRLYCLKLLRSGTREDYYQFVAAQLQSHPKQTLSFASFKKLAKYVQNLSDQDFKLLQTATILSAISLSDLAFDKAKHIQNISNIPHDNLEFLSATIRMDSTIYPLLQEFTQDQLSTKKLLYILFPPQTNFRHMLYSEGGAGMFKNLRTMIQHQFITKAEIDLWYAYWIVNIAGYRGHVAQDGSQYLTEPVFQAMQKLKILIDNMFAVPNYNPLIAYLEYRAELLGLSHLPREQALVLAHLGAMLRLYTVEEGKELYAGFNSLSLTEQNIFSQRYLNSIHDYASPVITHAPALFANARAILNNNTPNTIRFIVPIYNRACILLPAHTLSFNTLSASTNIEKMIKLGLEKSLTKMYADNIGEILLA